MAYLATAQLKERALGSALRYRGEYDSADADTAYHYAVARCGFENPTSSADVDYILKQYWLIEVMKLWFLKDYLDINRTKFDVGDLKASQIAKGLREDIKDIETYFDKAKEATESAHLFVSADSAFGEMVVASGIVDDAIGIDYRES